jgi:hypothetical protein
MERSSDGREPLVGSPGMLSSERIESEGSGKGRRTAGIVGDRVRKRAFGIQARNLCQMTRIEKCYGGGVRYARNQKASRRQNRLADALHPVLSLEIPDRPKRDPCRAGLLSLPAQRMRPSRVSYQQ